MPHTYITRKSGEEFLRYFEDLGIPRSFWLKRGIDPEVGAARPYERYTKEDIEPFERAHERIESKAQKAALRRKAEAEHGILIHRHKVLPERSDILPETRPDDVVSTEIPRRHWHGRNDPPVDDKYYEKRDPDAPDMIKHRWKWHTEPKGEMTDEKRAAMKRGEEPGNDEDVHVTRSPGKYHMPPTENVSVTRFEDHDEKYKPRFYSEADPDLQFGEGYSLYEPDKYENYREPWRRRAGHVKKYHKGVDVSQGRHPHTSRQKATDPDKIHGKRLDIHPWAADLLESAELVYFGIEGCQKADSILSAIRREDRKESVFSVPSIGQWLADELKDFAKGRLQGKVVIIVPDADWIDNPLVIEQARQCRFYLRSQCGIEAYVAAPPHMDGKVVHKGVDDYLGKGEGSLDSLMVKDRFIDEWALTEWLHRHVMDKRLKRSAGIALHALAEFHDDDGQYRPVLEHDAKLLGFGSRERVKRAYDALEKLGAARLEGDFAVRKYGHGGKVSWEPEGGVAVKKREGGFCETEYKARKSYGGEPVITLIPRELWGEDLPEYELREIKKKLEVRARLKAIRGAS